MKQKLQRSLFSLLFLVAGITSVGAQEASEANIKTLLANKTFVFRAQSAWPLQGTVVQLNPGFDMKIISDSINTYLPYFGRSYQASLTNTGGISFVSTKFEYKLKEKAKGGWELLIKPVDVKDITQLIYSISSNGYATLQVTSNSRQAISFYGMIEKAR